MRMTSRLRCSIDGLSDELLFDAKRQCSASASGISILADAAFAAYNRPRCFHPSIYIAKTTVPRGSFKRRANSTIDRGETMSVEVGDLAPDFELKSHTGGTVKLSDFRGKKNVFIAFYPLDWTPV
jgi:hypothetical protein